MSGLWNGLSQGFGYVLILAASVMLGWGTLGFLEYFTGLAPLVPLQNATFPGGTQFLHWLLITLSGSVFLTGYFLRWRYTPLAMIVLYAAIATLCAIETFDFMENPGRYWDFARECTYYVLISIYLVRSRRMRERFGEIMVVAER